MSKLAPPGAGLPIVELFIARIRFRLVCRRTNRQQAIADFQMHQASVLKAGESFSEEQAGTPMLIDRLRGLEDSSRNWSIYMAIEHLVIVNDSIGNICVGLSKGSVPDRAVSTADVKPNLGTGPEIIPVYEESCRSFVEKVSGIADLKTTTKFDHPWFGPLDAFQWLTLATFHMRLHLAQIDRIGQTLS